MVMLRCNCAPDDICDNCRAEEFKQERDVLRAEVADLKARLRALRARWCDCGGCLDCEAVARIGNLRVKNWRKP